MRFCISFPVIVVSVCNDVLNVSSIILFSSSVQAVRLIGSSKYEETYKKLNLFLQIVYQWIFYILLLFNRKEEGDNMFKFQNNEEARVFKW